MARETYSIKALTERNYDVLRLNDKWAALMGEITPKCLIMAYGNSGSGKSTTALELAVHIAELQNGKVLYDSHEEGINKTVRDRCIKHGVDYPKLSFTPGLSFERLMHKIRTTGPRVVVIDSVQMAGISSDQVKELRETFKKRKLVVILVSFGTGEGSTKGANDLLHDADVKMWHHKGQLTVHSRFVGEAVEVTLFKPTIKRAPKAGEIVFPEHLKVAQ
jgi:predicted ATP-dependent serine protease